MIKSIKNYFDLNNEYYILAAHGPYSLVRSTGFIGTIKIHTKKEYSSNIVNFSSNKTVSTGISNFKVKLHGKL